MKFPRPDFGSLFAELLVAPNLQISSNDSNEIRGKISRVPGRLPRRGLKWHLINPAKPERENLTILSSLTFHKPDLFVWLLCRFRLVHDLQDKIGRSNTSDKDG